MRRTIIVAAIFFAACNKRTESSTQIAAPPAGDANRGRQLVQQYGCPSCHRIPGTAGPKGVIGPSLEHVGARPVIGEKAVPNTRDNMTRWLQNPQAFDPASTMPALGVTPDDARDLAAFLSTLR